MEEPFRLLKEISRDFYRGWKWSIEHKSNRKEFEAFVNQVEEPLNLEIGKLINQGYSMNQIETFMTEAQIEVWPEFKKNFCMR